MGDVQQYYIVSGDSVSWGKKPLLSGHYFRLSHCMKQVNHVVVNPITQLAFTLNSSAKISLLPGLLTLNITVVVAWTSTSLHPNLSFFFSNSALDPEQVHSYWQSRKTEFWAVAMRDKIHCPPLGLGSVMNALRNSSLSNLHHIQTSGRSLHAQEIDFNDIRTTLQA